MHKSKGWFLRFSLVYFLLNIFVIQIYILQFNFQNIFILLFAMIALAAQATLIALPFLLISWLVLLIYDHFIKRLFLAIILITPLLYYIVDYNSYKILGMHVNSLVIKLLLSKQARATMHLKTSEWVLFYIIIIVLVVVVYNLISYSFIKNFKVKFFKHLLLPILFFATVDRVVYSIADLYGYISIVKISNLIPFYQPTTIRRFAHAKFGFDMKKTYKVVQVSAVKSLNYPTQKITYSNIRNKPNILWIIADGLRFDMVTKQYMPYVYNFSSKAVVFDNHYSGGNSTRFGMFSMFYGVYSMLWHQFLPVRQGPVFLERLLGLGYDIKPMAGASLNFPEFNQTLFINPKIIPEDEWGSADVATRDLKMTNSFTEYLQNKALKDNNTPFFAMLFYDSTHGPYNYTPEFEKYSDNLERFSFAKYKNSVVYTDSLINKVLVSLKETKQLENTIIVITSDHGEEFGDSGYFGHAGVFTDAQSKIPFIYYDSSKPAARVAKLTSHIDIVPTFMELLAAKKGETKKYSNGMNLFDDTKRDFVTVCNWDRCALVTKNSRLVFGYQPYNASISEIRTNDYVLDNKHENKFNNYLINFLHSVNKFGEQY